ncbi:MAG: T9SS type A sorting domain-containing protein, partial [bacterium]|nr:T9SS type A sorting domain-containing protein [bacterium]
RNTGSSGTISFAAKVDFITGAGPSSVSTGDYDGDGKTDLAVANQGSNTVSVFRNTGSSGTISFAAKVDFTTGTQPKSVSTGDFDGDGKTDLAVANYNSITVSVFRNTGSNGTISFATKVDFITDAYPISVSAGDFDGDGKPDLVVGSNTVSVFRNTGNSGTVSFAAKVDFITGSPTRCVSTGDLDGDGKTDLAVANDGNNTVSVFRNLNGICFPTITSFTPTSGLVGTTVTITGTYFNATLANNIVFFGATKATVSAGSSTSLTVTVPTGASYQPISVINLTTGLTAYSAKPFITTFACGGEINSNSFATKVDQTTGANPYSVSTGDFDGDGKTDLAVHRGPISVLRNTDSTGTVSFTSPVYLGMGNGSINPYSILTADFDGDGKPDLAATNDGAVAVLRNTSTAGTISFASRLDFGTSSQPRGVSTGDFDGDGKPDLAVTNYDGNSVSVLRNTTPAGIGTISFAYRVDFNTGTNPFSVSAGDFDGDGKTDLAVTNKGSNTVSIFRNTSSSGTISFAAKVDYATGTQPVSVSIGDLDLDGKPDLAVANNGSNSVSVFRNTGSSGTISFASKVDYATGTGPQSVSIGNFEGDDKPDLAVANLLSYTVSVFRNTGSSGTISFAAKVDFATGTSPYSVSTGDFNRDGKTDLAVANSSSNAVSIIRNTVLVPTVTANATATTVCIDSSITLTGGGANTYVWTGGVINGVAFVPPTGTTTYTVTGTVTATGCQNTATIAITVNLLPTVTANATATTVCAGTSITLTGTGTANSYSWSGGVTNGVAFVPPIGTTNYTVTGIAGCKKTATIAITVNPLPIVIANATAIKVCIGDTITLTGGGADSYTWTGGVINGVQFVPPVGIINYTVTGTDLNGCTNTASKNITTNPLPAVEAILANDITKCSGICNATATIINITGGQSPYSILWDAKAKNQTTLTASFLCQGNYSVVIKDANLCSITEKAQINIATISDPNVYLTNLAAIDQVNISPSFAAFYTYSLPATINPNSTNPRNFVDPGKKARFKVECTNQKGNGQSIVSGICKVRSNNPYITITDSSSALNNIGWNNKAWSADEFEIDIDPNTPPGTNAYIDFVVQENGQDYSTTCISIPITPLVYSTTTPSTIDDDSNPDSQGNDNDICEPGEIIEFYPWLDNVSTLNAEYVRGRFENLENLSFVDIWNNVQGTNTTVFDAGWWNFSFAKPQIINSNSFNTTPEYDFVFKYNNSNIINKFKLYMVMAGGFKLFSGNALSLVQWSLPFTFLGTSSTSIGSELGKTDYLNVYPNPTNDIITIENKGANLVSTYVILDALGKQILSGKLIGESTTIDINQLSSGIYLLQVGETEKWCYKLIKL